MRKIIIIKELYRISIFFDKSMGKQCSLHSHCAASTPRIRAFLQRCTAPREQRSAKSTIMESSSLRRVQPTELGTQIGTVLLYGPIASNDARWVVPE